ncbi:MAG TPA: LuxR C-terminal-related transcriptional regulator [Sphingomicrobium sp.]
MTQTFFAQHAPSPQAAISMASSAAQESDAPALVHIVDPDKGARQALSGVLRAARLFTQGYASLGELLAASPLDRPGCLIIDSGVPLVSLLELGDQLWKDAPQHPIVIMGQRLDVSMVVRAMKSGVTDLLQKPLKEQEALDAVEAALCLDFARRQKAMRLAEIRARFSTLSNRERQVLTLVTAGRLNKQVAWDLGLSEITVKVHRGRAMRKMGARTLVDLVRMADAINSANCPTGGRGWAQPPKENPSLGSAATTSGFGRANAGSLSLR